MVKFGVHSFVWVGEWDTDNGNYAIQKSGEAGYDIIEIPMLKPEEFDASSHKAALKKAGLEPTCSLALPAAVHMPRHPESAREFLIKALEQVEAVGSQYLGGCIAYSLGVLTGEPPKDSERQVVIDILKDISVEASKRGITIALEPCNRYETYMYNTLKDVRDTILAVDVDNLQLHADTYHMNIEETNMRDPFVNTADVLNYVHMSESHRGMLGSGTINWEQTWQGLKDSNFDGYLVIESFASINPDLAAATCLWRPPSQSSETIAASGLEFLKLGASKYSLI